MKKLLRKIISKIWKYPYIKFTHDEQSCDMKIYWPLINSENTLKAIYALSANLFLIHDNYSKNVQMCLRKTILGFGKRHNEQFISYVILNIIDGMELDEAVEYANNSVFNVDPPECKVIENIKTEPESKESTFIHPASFYPFHHAREHL